MGYNNRLYAGYQSQIHSAEGWRNYIAEGKNKITRPIANNTSVRLIAGGQDVAIRLHQTDIITFNSTGTITLNSGGWLSATTKERINKYTNAGITQKAGVWYMGDGSLFYDGVTILYDGTVTAPKQPDKYERKLVIIKKQAKQYAHGFVEALKAGKVDMPSAGDCWYCLFIDKPEHPASGDHIKDHMKHNYYVPSLLVNAMKAAGYRDEQMGLVLTGGRQLFIDPERHIYKYVVRHLQRGL